MVVNLAIVYRFQLYAHANMHVMFSCYWFFVFSYVSAVLHGSLFLDIVVLIAVYVSNK